MTYVIPYEADFECSKGHKFTTLVRPAARDNTVMCPVCWQEWLDANIPRGHQVSKPREVVGVIEL